MKTQATLMLLTLIAMAASKDKEKKEDSDDDDEARWAGAVGREDSGLDSLALGQPCASGFKTDSKTADCSESCSKDRSYRQCQMCLCRACPYCASSPPPLPYPPPPSASPSPPPPPPSPCPPPRPPRPPPPPPSPPAPPPGSPPPVSCGVGSAECRASGVCEACCKSYLFRPDSCMACVTIECA